MASAINAPDAMLAAGLILGVTLAILSPPLLRSLTASARRDAADSPAPTTQPAGLSRPSQRRISAAPIVARSASGVT